MVKQSYDEAAENLKQAARDNLPDLCAEFYGKARSGNIYVNAEALKIAAENKNYEAFERMLELSAEDNCGVTTPLSIGLGRDWNRVEEIAKTDMRIAKALERYDEKLDSNIENFLTEIGYSDRTDARQSQTFLQKLKFW